MCEENPRLATDTIDKFARYLRVNVDTLGRIDVVPFEKELQHVQNYLEIESLRFDHVKVVYDILETDFDLPVLTIQPIVENAIKYGARANKNGLVKISSRKENGWHVVSVYDNGAGFDVENVLYKEGEDRVHCGIALVRDRLEKISNGRLEIKSTIGEGTLVNIKIPCEVKHERNMC